MKTITWRIYVKGELFKVCKSTEERQEAIDELKKDKTLKPRDINFVMFAPD